MDDIITIELFGQRYSFKADSGTTNADKVADLLVQEVDRVERQMADKTSSMDKKFNILALAALNITSEFLELKQTHTELLQNVYERSNSLIETIDVNLQ